MRRPHHRPHPPRLAQGRPEPRPHKHEPPARPNEHRKHLTQLLDQSHRMLGHPSMTHQPLTSLEREHLQQATQDINRTLAAA